MASMWRRAMVYLGLQDDDELEYSGEYESYGGYGDTGEEPPNARPRHDDPGDGRPVRDTGTVRTRPDDGGGYGAEYGADYGADYGAAPEPAPAPAPRVAPREDPSGVSAPRPSVV